MVLVAMSATSVFAADFYVAKNGDDSNPGTKEKPFGSPEAAFLAVAYQGTTPCNVYLEENATFQTGSIRIEDGCIVNVYGKNTTLKAADQPGKNGGEGSRIMRLGVNTEVSISGVNFVNGRQVAYFAGGAIFTLGKSLVIDDCSFVGNEAGSAGGAIASRGHYLKVTNSYFDSNYTIGGGACGAAISMVGNIDAENFGELYVENCAFVNNEIAENGGGHATVISIYDPCEDVSYSMTGKVSVINCTFLNNKNIQGYQADVDITDNGDCTLYMVNNTMVGGDCGLRILYQSVPCYLFNNFIYANKSGIADEYSVSEYGREAITAANNIIIGGELAVNENIDDPMLSGNGNTLGTAATNSLASFGISSNITREGNVGYLVIGPTSPLLDKGLSDSSQYTGENVIPASDCRGFGSTSSKDIGAYEYGAVAPGADGIADAEFDLSVPAVYYNLQGVQIQNPENGIYIERRGGSARKVFIK